MGAIRQLEDMVAEHSELDYDDPVVVRWDFETSEERPLVVEDLDGNVLSREEVVYLENVTLEANDEAFLVGEIVSVGMDAETEWNMENSLFMNDVAIARPGNSSFTIIDSATSDLDLGDEVSEVFRAFVTEEDVGLMFADDG